MEDKKIHPAIAEFALGERQELLAQIAEQAREIAYLSSFQNAFEEWHKKTEWVQGDVDCGAISFKALGRHRADIMTDLIQSLRAELAALKQPVSNAVVMPEPDFYWVEADEGSWNSPEEWAQDYYDYNGEKPESVSFSCAIELPNREYDSFEFDADGSCISCRLVNDEVARLNPSRGVPDIAPLLSISRKILEKLQHPTASVHAADMWKLEDALAPFDAAPSQPEHCGVVVPRELLEQLLVGHLGIDYKAAKQKLRALLAGGDK